MMEFAYRRSFDLRTKAGWSSLWVETKHAVRDWFGFRWALVNSWEDSFSRRA